MADYLNELLRHDNYGGYYLFADKKAWQLAHDRVSPIYSKLNSLPCYLISDPEQMKGLEGIAQMVHWLLEQGANRSATLIAVGGGAVSDAVGFLAQIYMRGVSLILLPTTLLAMADAAIGGKCGVNFASVKNLLGVFTSEERTLTLCDTAWLETLPYEELLSGFGELLKYGLLISEELWHRIIQLIDVHLTDIAQLTPIIREAVLFKLEIVSQDRLDLGLRHQLNLGHTFGHAFEAWSYTHSNRALLHGEAVALGLIPELYLSYLKLSLSKEILRQLITTVKELYSPLQITCQDYGRLKELMLHDKKNSGSELISTVGLEAIGLTRGLRHTSQEITEALDFYQDTML
jgi:3-dehydroquinate synthetase